MDYTTWSLDELEQLRVYLGSRGAGANEMDAVMREIRRRGSAGAPGSGIAPATSHTDSGAHQAIARPEGVGVALRFVAVLIDTAIFFVLGFVIGLVSGAAYTSSSGGTHAAGFHLGSGGFIVWLFIGLVYYVSFERLLGGTLGKRALGLRVVDEEGHQITWGASVVRNLLRIVDGFFFYVVGAIVIWSSPAHQRLGDRAAHTLVVRS